MAGGSGTRFWPKSTTERPKQLLTFDGGGSFLARTLARFDDLVAADHRLVVTTARLAKAITGETPDVLVLAEPDGRNTAPCIYWAARVIGERDGDAVMLVMSADHHIADTGVFRTVVRQAAEWAATHDDLVTLGVTPSRPETGYGYLATGHEIGRTCRKVAEFVEKPDRERAEQFLEAGTYLWNSGMFAWRIPVILEAFDRFLPEIREAWDAAGNDAEKAYPRIPVISVDHGILEKATNVVTFPLDCGWEDVGSWLALENLADALGARTTAGAVFGGQIVAVDARGNIVDAPGKVVALLGVEDLIVVHHGDAVLVASKPRAQDVRRLVDEVKRVRPELT
jgi:mannose-1-phosphate guanylyltransferase